MKKLYIVLSFCTAVFAHETMADNEVRFIISRAPSVLEKAQLLGDVAEYVLTGNDVLKAVGSGLQILENGLVKKTFDLASGATVFSLGPVREGGLLLQAINERDVPCAFYRVGKLGLYFYSVPLYTLADYLETGSNAYGIYNQMLSANKRFQDNLSKFPKEAKCSLY